MFKDIDCCHLALFLTFVILVIIVVLIPCAFGFRLKVEKWMFELKRELREVETVNGKEKRDIQQLQAKFAEFEKWMNGKEKLN